MPDYGWSTWKPTMVEIKEVVVYVFGGGLLASLAAAVKFWRDLRIYKIEARKGEQELDSYVEKRLLERIKDDRAYLEHKIQALEEDRDKERSRMLEVIENLRRRIMDLEMAHAHTNLPMSISDRSGVYRDCNSAFEVKILNPLGKTREQFIGHRAVDVFPEELCLKLNAMREKAKFHTFSVQGGVIFHDDLPPMTVIKEVISSTPLPGSVSSPIFYRTIICPEE